MMVRLSLRLMHQATAVLRQRNSALTLFCYNNDVFDCVQGDVLNQPMSRKGTLILTPASQVSYGMLQ
jgi:hypothetical protein